jgi:hypothetical protein
MNKKITSVFIAALLATSLIFPGPIFGDALEERKAKELYDWAVMDAALFMAGSFGIAATDAFEKLLMARPNLASRALKGVSFAMTGTSLVIAVILFVKELKTAHGSTSFASEDAIQELFVDMKVKKHARDKSPENPYIKVDYLISKKMYHLWLRNFVENQPTKERSLALLLIDNTLNDIEREYIEIRKEIFSLSREDQKTHLLQKSELYEQIKKENLRAEIVKKTEQIATLFKETIQKQSN